MLWNFILAFIDIPFQRVLVRPCEGCHTSHHFVKCSPQTPHVNLATVLFSIENLRRHVERRPTVCVRLISVVFLLGKTQVGYHYINIANQLSFPFEILKLGVTVDNQLA